MDARISPDPTEEERRAILAAVGDRDDPRGHAAYESPWRLAGLNHADGGQWDHDRNGNALVGKSATSRP